MKFVTMRKKGVLKMAIVIVFAAAVIAGVSITGAATVWSGNSPKRIAIYSVDTPNQVVALTFNVHNTASARISPTNEVVVTNEEGNDIVDEPETKESACCEGINSILRELEAQNINATFFVSGLWAKQFAPTLNRVVASNRAEIGNLSSTHPDRFHRLNAHQLEKEIRVANTTINNLTGVSPKVFRAPNGLYSDRVLNAANTEGLVSVQGDIHITNDGVMNSEQIALKVMNSVQNGSIIMIDISNCCQVFDALPLVVLGLKNKGFSFVQVSELVLRENYTLDRAGRQFKE
ncbi:MAG: polysaccharide deacetylase family protein [Firmicutes bacterium]|nr:polysaccharide deacetylase family protein [Bacillota bacterium]MCL2256019.1 polysaccharide deacetylase family protein [Bacillota bacterium]